MKKKLGIVLMIGLMWFMAGCSSFVSPPRMARIQIKGPANHSNEFVVSMDDLTHRNTDIYLSDRYAVNIDFKWLWYSQEDLGTIASETPAEIQAPLTPWVLCKYRF
ncbi:MAG: hypothetical protein HZB87_02140 [Desulfatitalea sp.]|nr:hypothetical protein [Desulfatitalea sp.]